MCQQGIESKRRAALTQQSDHARGVDGGPQLVRRFAQLCLFLNEKLRVEAAFDRAAILGVRPGTAIFGVAQLRLEGSDGTAFFALRFQRRERDFPPGGRIL